MTDDDKQRVEALKAKLTARRGKPGFEANVRAIEAEIATLEAKE